MERYKTIHENKVMINPPTDLDLSVRALNSIKQANIKTVDELFNLSINDMIVLKFGKRTINEIKELKSSYITEKPLLKLDRYTPLNNGQMLEDLYGEYVLFSDVSALFSLSTE